MSSGDAKKIRLIEFVQRIGREADAVAASDALELARDPKNEEKQAKASGSVRVSDRLDRMAKLIIDQIHANWPQESNYTATLEEALRQALHVMEKGMEVRMGDQWPALKPIPPEAIAEAKRVLNIETK